MPGMKYRPSPCDTASYTVADGTCTALMVAPGTTAPCESFTRPVRPLEVTPCALAVTTGEIRAHSANSINVRKIVRLIRFSKYWGRKRRVTAGFADERIVSSA